MKKLLVFVLISFLANSIFLLSDEKQDLWKRADVETNLEQKFSILEEYAAAYPQDENAKVLYWNLSVLSYQLKKYDKTIKYGELALAQEGIDNNNRLNLYLYLANSYNVTKTDLEKAFHYAGQVVSLAKVLKGDEKVSPRYDKSYIVPALRIQIQILYAKGKNEPQKMLEAADKAVEVYNDFDQSLRSSRMILTLADLLYKINKKDEAIDALEQIIDEERPNPKYIGLLASWLSKRGRAEDKEKAVNYLEKSYQARKNVKTAYNIAILVQKNDLNKALKYLADAHMMNPDNKSSDAFKLLRHLFYNVKEKNKPQEEQDSAFNALLNEARARLGM